MPAELNLKVRQATFTVGVAKCTDIVDEETISLDGILEALLPVP